MLPKKVWPLTSILDVIEMGKNLFELFTEIIEKEQYSYYSYGLLVKKAIDELLDDKKSCDSFVNDFFVAGSKQNFFGPEDVLRSQHLVSTYLFGIIFARNTNLESCIEKAFELNNNTSGNYSFLYYWFITSLYHDQSFFQEKEIRKIDFRYFYELINSKAFYFGNEMEYWSYPGQYSPETYLRYFYFIRTERESLEHGFVGGLTLFERSKKNFTQNFKKSFFENKDIDKKDFVRNGLHWTEKHLEIFRRIAFSIMDHNIWRQENQKLIRKYGLEETYSQNKNRIDPESKPLTFLLCLVDTLDPYKLFENEKQIKPNLTLKQFLMDIEISFNEERLKFIIKNGGTSKVYKSFFERILKTNNWLKVKVVDHQSGNDVGVEIYWGSAALGLFDEDFWLS